MVKLGGIRHRFPTQIGLLKVSSVNRVRYLNAQHLVAKWLLRSFIYFEPCNLTNEMLSFDSHFFKMTILSFNLIL